MIRTALDTSVVVAGLLMWHQDRARAAAGIKASSGPGHRLVLPLTVLIQSFSVLTRLPPHRRLPPKAAFDNLHASFAGHADIPGPPDDGGWMMLENAVASGAVGGGIHDFEILDDAVRAGVTRLLTLNPDDFRRFGNRGVEIVEP